MFHEFATQGAHSNSAVTVYAQLNLVDGLIFRWKQYSLGAVERAVHSRVFVRAGWSRDRQELLAKPELKSELK